MKRKNQKNRQKAMMDKRKSLTVLLNPRRQRRKLIRAKKQKMQKKTIKRALTRQLVKMMRKKIKNELCD